MKVGGICGECGKYYNGECCPKCIHIDKGIAPAMHFDYHDSWYSKALGCVITSKQQRKQIMKERNLVEVGNDWKSVDPERGRKDMDRKVAKEFDGLAKEALARWN